MLRSNNGDIAIGGDGMDEDEDDVSDDDIAEEVVDDSMFSMDMSKQEKIMARKPWQTSLTIKLVRRRIGYQFLLIRLQAMWKIQAGIVFIDLPNDFFIVRFKVKEEYDTTLLNGPWMLGDHSLHVQRW